MILKYSYLDARWILASQAGGELDLLMNSVVMPDESADESNHYRWWLRSTSDHLRCREVIRGKD